MTITRYENPLGEVELHRYPSFPNSKAQQNLQAWEGADTLLLEYASTLNLTPDTSVLILNDQFGALTCPLAKFQPVVQSDSFLSHTAIAQNLNTNKLNLGAALLRSTDQLNGSFDYIFIKVPKSLSLLEHQLYSLRTVIHENTKIVASAMVKALSKNVCSLFEKILGPSSQSLAARKARLIHCAPEPSHWTGNTVFPRSFNAFGLTLSCHANVFSEGRVDPGTQVFLNNINLLPQADSLIDLACGSGIMGIHSAKHCNARHAYFCDESFMSVDSCQHNAIEHLKSTGVTVTASNGIPENFPQVELIICNPPFHQQQVMMTDMAFAMFKDAKRHLKTGGELWIVANRHLGYHAPLKRFFGNCTNMAKHSKYVLLRAKKQPL